MFCWFWTFARKNQATVETVAAVFSVFPPLTLGLRLIRIVVERTHFGVHRDIAALALPEPFAGLPVFALSRALALAPETVVPFTQNTKAPDGPGLLIVVRNLVSAGDGAARGAAQGYRPSAVPDPSPRPTH
jgi:hypothetical protein